MAAMKVFQTHIRQCNSVEFVRGCIADSGDWRLVFEVAEVKT